MVEPFMIIVYYIYNILCIYNIPLYPMKTRMEVIAPSFTFASTPASLANSSMTCAKDDATYS